MPFSSSAIQTLCTNGLDIQSVSVETKVLVGRVLTHQKQLPYNWRFVSAAWFATVTAAKPVALVW